MMHWLLMLSVSLISCRAFPLPTQYPFHVVDEVDEERYEGPFSLSWEDQVKGIDQIGLSTSSTGIGGNNNENPNNNSKDNLEPIEDIRVEESLSHFETGPEVLHFSHGNSTKGHTPDKKNNVNDDVNAKDVNINAYFANEITKDSITPRTLLPAHDAYVSTHDSFNAKETNSKTSRFVLTTAGQPVEGRTKMVYISHSSNDLTSSPSLSNVPWTQDAATKDVLLGVCVTVAGVFTLCVLLTFTSCCCRKRKSSEDGSVSDDAEDRENGQTFNNRRKDPLKKAPSSSGLDSPTEGSSSLKQLDIRKSCPNFQDVESNSMSVKDRIKAFEFFQNEQDIKLREGSKPKRKKPTSRAFDDFESQGILIGFGGNQRKNNVSTEGLTPDAGEELKDYHQLPPIPTAAHLHPHHQQDRLTNQQQTEEQNGPSDEFEAVQRNTDILKSFRRAPPPKNRTRARRSGRRRPHGANDGVTSIAEDREDEEKEFESSLRMQPSTPQSTTRTTIKAIAYLSKDTTDSLNCSFGDSPLSQRASLRSQRGTASSRFSDFDLKQHKPNELTIDFKKDFDSVSNIRSCSFSEGLSNSDNTSIQQKKPTAKLPKFPQPLNADPFKYSLNPANVTLSSLRRDLPIGKKMDVNHNGHHRNSHNSRSENWSPQPQRPMSVGGIPMRRWASDHSPSDAPREVAPRSPLLDVRTWTTHGNNNKDEPNSDTTGRKCRYDEGEQERIYPKSEKLLRKAIGSIPGNFTPPPNLLYRPYYHTSNNVNHEHQLSNDNRQYQRTRSETWAGNADSMIVHFNIDTEPTNV